MFIRVTRGRIDPSRYDEMSQLVPDVAASVGRQPGFHSYLQGGDRASGKIIAISTWDTAEHAALDRTTALTDVMVLTLGLRVAPGLYPPARVAVCRW